MVPETVLLIDKWPRWTRIFFLVLAAALGLMIWIAEEQHEIRGVVILSLFTWICGSLAFLRLRIELDPSCGEVVIIRDWIRWRSCRRIPTNRIRSVFLRPVGKGSHELGLLLEDGGEIVLCQPMGYYDDRAGLATHVARSVGVPFQPANGSS